MFTSLDKKLDRTLGEKTWMSTIESRTQCPTESDNHMHKENVHRDSLNLLELVV